MSADELMIIDRLSRCRYAPGTWSKRFVMALSSTAKQNPEVELSESQRQWMYRTLYKKRKQLPNTYEKFKTHEHCKLLK